MNFRELAGSFITNLGDFSYFVLETLRSVRGIWRRYGLLIRHSEFIGVNSIGVLTVAGIFLGAVLGYQLYVAFHMFGAEALLGGSVGVALFRELGPVMTAVMVTGRAGAAIAAEIASMRISEQIDALEVMAINPYEYLVAPRVIAATVMVPILSVFFAMVATYASAGVSCGIMGMDWTVFWHQYRKVIEQIELTHCLVKGAVFGLVLAWIACFFGFRAYGGARAVGFATRSTVVVSFLAILLSDYILTSLLPFGFYILKVKT